MAAVEEWRVPSSSSICSAMRISSCAAAKCQQNMFCSGFHLDKIPWFNCCSTVYLLSFTLVNLLIEKDVRDAGGGKSVFNQYYGLIMNY